MDTYKVDIRFPSLNTSDPVVISGMADNVEEAKDQLLLLEEEYVSLNLFLSHPCGLHVLLISINLFSFVQSVKTQFHTYFFQSML